MLKDKIRFLCIQKGISITKLEEALGLANGIIGRWDKSSPRAETLAKVADYFNVSVDYLLGRPDPTSTNKNEITNEIMDIYNDLTPEQQQELMEFAKFKASQNKIKQGA